MPQIPMINARGDAGALYIPKPSPDVFGRQAGEAATQFGQTLSAIGQKAQDNQDGLDLIKASSDYAIQFDEKKGEILKHPDRSKHREMVASASQSVHDTVISGTPGMSSAARTAFKQHVAKSIAPATIDIAHESLALQIERQTVEIDESGQKMAAAYGQNIRQQNGSLIEGVANSSHALQSMEQNGTIHPKDAQAIRERWANRFWEQRAVAYPQLTQHVAKTGTHGPDDFPMDPGKAMYYHNISQAQITAIDKTRAAYKEEEKDAVELEIFSGMWGNGKGAGGSRDMSMEIEENRHILGSKDYNQRMKDNLEVLNAKKQFTITGGERRISEYIQSGLLYLAERAKYEPELLEGAINFDIVKRHVFKDGDLHPDDAAPIYAAISAAMQHHGSADSTLKKAQTDAMKSLDVYVPQLATSADSFLLKNIQDSMQRQLRAELESNPRATPVQIRTMADTIRSHGELRILGAQKLTAIQVDEELFGMELHWKSIDPSLVGNKHDLKPAARTKLEKQYPLLKGLFRLHDVRRERFEQLIAVGEAQAERAAKGKK